MGPDYRAPDFPLPKSQAKRPTSTASVDLQNAGESFRKIQAHFGPLFGTKLGMAERGRAPRETEMHFVTRNNIKVSTTRSVVEHVRCLSFSMLACFLSHYKVC